MKTKKKSDDKKENEKFQKIESIDQSINYDGFYFVLFVSFFGIQLIN